MLYAQEKTFYLEEWYATAGEQAEAIGRLVSIADDAANLYVAGSQLNEYGKYDLLLTKYDDTGNELWSARFNVPDSTGNAIAGDIALGGSGYVIVTGTVYNGPSNNYDAFAVKFNSSGTEQWHATYDGAGSFYDGGAHVYIDASDNVYIAGGTSSFSSSMDMLCVKYNSSGAQNWAQTVDGFGLYDVGSLLLPQESGDLLLAGAVQKSATAWAVGSIQLNSISGAPSSSLNTTDSVALEEVTALAADGSDNIYAAGYSSAGGNGKDFVTLKIEISSSVSLDWAAAYDGGYHGDDVPRSIAFDGSGNVYVAGYTTTATGRDFLAIKYNSSGAKQWVTQLDGPARQDDEARAVAVDESGNIVAAGYATQNGSRDYYTALLYASDGSLAWEATFNGLANKDDEASHVAVDAAGNITVLGKNQTAEPEATTYTTVRYAKKDILLPPDPEAASTALSFIENRGQLTDSSGTVVEEVRFYNTSSFPATYFHHDRISFVTAAIDTTAETPDTLHRVDMTFKNGKNDARVFGLSQREAYHNYYLGHIPEGRARVGLYERAVQTDIYNKIDLMAYSNNAGVKYYFVIKPGGDPEDIQLDFGGQSGLAATEIGGVEVATSVGAFELPPPKAYQVSAEGERVAVEWQPEYEIEGDSLVRFVEMDEYDEEKHLVIEVGRPGGIHTSADDDWVTHFGSTGAGGQFDPGDDLTSLFVDDEGNLFVTGFSSSAFFPLVNGSLIFGAPGGFVDGLAAKFNSDAVLEFLTFFGGSNLDVSRDIAVSNGNLIAVGDTDSNDFPAFVGSGNGSSGDGFIVSINSSSGELKNSRLYGGTLRDQLRGVDAWQGRVLITGSSSSTNFPTQDIAGAYFQEFNNSAQGDDRDAIIMEVETESLDLIWSTYFGGTNYEVADDIVINQIDGNFYLVGVTRTTFYHNVNCNVPDIGGGFPGCKPSGADQFSFGNGGNYVSESEDVYKGIVDITLSDFFSNQDIPFRLFDSRGALTMQGTTNKQLYFSLDLTKLPAGVYFFTLLDESMPIVKQ